MLNPVSCARKYCDNIYTFVLISAIHSFSFYSLESSCECVLCTSTTLPDLLENLTHPDNDCISKIHERCQQTDRQTDRQKRGCTHTCRRSHKDNSTHVAHSDMHVNSVQHSPAFTVQFNCSLD